MPPSSMPHALPTQADERGGRRLLDSVTKQDNEFGYKPVAVEWDIWLCPKKPWDLARARIVSV